MSNKNCGDLWSFLKCLYQTPVPSPGTKFTIDYSDDKFFVAECPNHISLPSIPENRNLSEYYNAVDVKNMMLIFASMLNERRIIVTSERVSRLSACVQAANSLIYPMSWQHIFIPVLPQHLLDYLNAPMPFLIGVAWNLMLKVRQEELGDVVILNADTNEVDTPFADLQNIPEEVVSSLKKNLSPANNLIGDSVARAFLRAVVQLIGNYREALQFRESDRKITFNREKFVTQRPPHFQPFVRKMLELQIFSQVKEFIEERLELLNSGLHTSDEFEIEASVYGEKSSSKVRQILSNVRKESGAIMKNVKSKTNPAMKSAVKSVSKGGKNVREKSLNTYKEIRGKIKDIQQKNSENGPYANGLKPRSAPSSPTYPVKRPMKSISGVYEGYTARTTYKRASQPSPGLNSVNSMSSKNLNNSNQSQGDSQKTPSPQEIDLLGEMRDVLNSQLGLSSTTSMSITETASNSSLNSSILSSDASNSFFSSDAFSNYPKDIHPSDSLNNDNERIMPPEGSKRWETINILKNLDLTIFAGSNIYKGGMNGDWPINASYTSLPLLDLSLDIPLPPPLFPPSAAFPKKHSSVAEGVSSTRSRHSSFRSPKIFPPETFGSLPSSLEDTTVNFTSSSAFGGGSNVGLYSRPKAYTLPVEGERQVGRIPSEVVAPRRRHFINIPKYDVNPSFSESLAKFSTKENFSSYFYSSLAKPCSKSSNSVFDMHFEATELQIKPVVYSQKTNSSNSYHNNNQTVAASTPLSPPDILRDPSPNPSTVNWDIMTMSLPLDIKSISDIPTNNPSSFSHPQHPPYPPPSSSSSATRKSAAVISSHPTLLTPPPRYRRRRKKATIPAQENDSSQDILLMDSPKEEEFRSTFVQRHPSTCSESQIIDANTSALRY
ncbi:DENN domain-containing protein 1A [Armadillidium nasatum]|uniref:DENN domain-containing protein 1A n=1 Tax=Armadillidium nasatum TaxID=96803 RepID=A0A5N5THU4_9CRUS|nr:DENN domain-containing protein 1A [Armadillidium nasatum]